MKGLVSIIIPVYNREQSVVHSIRSVFGLNYTEWELIIVDDGSGDSTLSVCKTIVKDEPRAIITSQPNGGVSKARNTGISMAHGQWLLFLDSDDVLAPDYLDDLNVPPIELFPDMYMFGRGSAVLRDDAVYIESYPVVSPKLVMGNTNIYKHLYEINDPYRHPVFFCTDKLFATSIIRDNKLSFKEDVDLGEDQIFIMNYLEYANCLFYNMTRKYCGLRGGNIINNHLSGKLRTPEQHYINIMANHEALYNGYLHSGVEAVRDYAQNYILDRFISKIFYSYCIPKNRLLIDVDALERFCKDKLIPIYKQYYADFPIIKDGYVRHLAYALIKGESAKYLLYRSYWHLKRERVLQTAKAIVKKVIKRFFHSN